MFSFTRFRQQLLPTDNAAATVTRLFGYVKPGGIRHASLAVPLTRMTRGSMRLENLQMVLVHDSVVTSLKLIISVGLFVAV